MNRVGNLINSDKPQTDRKSLRYWTKEFSDQIIEKRTYNSRIALESDIKKLEEFFLSQGKDKVEELSQTDLENFFRSLMKSFAKKTIGRILTTINLFFTFLMENEAITYTKNPVRHIKIKTILDENLELEPSLVKAVFSDGKTLAGEDVYKQVLEDAKRLLSRKNAGKLNVYRNYAILTISIRTGIFPTQLVMLEMNQVRLDYDKREGTFLDLKEGRRETSYNIKLAPDVVEAIYLYFQKERGWGPGYVFRSKTGKRLYRQDIRRLLARMIRKAVTSTENLTQITFNPRGIRNQKIHELNQMHMKGSEIARLMGCRDARCVQRF